MEHFDQRFKFNSSCVASFKYCFVEKDNGIRETFFMRLSAETYAAIKAK